MLLRALSSAAMAIQIVNRDTIGLRALKSWANEFDDAGDGACWPARRFVAWVEQNLAERDDERHGETRRAGQRRDPR